jgi:superfamily II DNA or RNA helicase
MSRLDTFLAVIRRNSRPGTWSQGVSLARQSGVAIESRDDDEIVLRVRTPGKPVAPTVVLYPGEREWDCDCGSRVSPCEHVAAAAIALGPAESDATAALPPPVTAVFRHVVYRFTRAESGLRLERFISDGGDERSPGTKLVGTLSGLLAKPDEAATIALEQYDLKVDLLIEAGSRGILPPTRLEALLRLLIGARYVLLEGEPVACVEEEILPRAIVADAGDDVVVTITRDPRIIEVLSPGVGLSSDGTLARLGESELTGGWLQHLPIVRNYRSSQIGEVATKILPDLSRRMSVDVRSRRLPRVVRDLEPRVLLELNHLGQGLSVLPTLVYGSPPCVRIDDGKMVYLGGPVPVRSSEAEQRLVHRLRDELNLVPGHRAQFDGKDGAVFAQKLQRWRGGLTGDAADIVKPRARLVPQLKVDSASEGDGTGGVRFDLSFRVVEPGGPEGGQERSADAQAVLRAWQEGLGLVPIDGGGWAPLPLDWLAKHGERLADLLAARQANGVLANHALATLGTLCAALEYPPPPGLERLAPIAESWDRLPEAALPADLTATLRPYQQRGVDWLGFLRRAGLGGILADDMGLGKTLQTLAMLQKGEKTLVVCPTSVLPNWQNELARFRPALRVCAYHGAGRRLDPDADVVLTSYALLRLDSERLSAGGPKDGGKPRRWDVVVLDEAQAIKNPDSQVARAAFALEAETRLCLTGTPIENRLEELWSLVHFTNRGLLGGRRAFEDRYARPIAEGVAGAAAGLRKKIRPFVLRRQKSEVAPDLPPRSEAILRVALDDRERELYDAVRASTRAEIVAMLAGEGGGVMKALEALLRLRQASCHPALLPGQEARTSSKLERLVEALEIAGDEGHKALVFSQWTSLLDLIEKRLSGTGIAYCRLDGSTRDRGEVVNRFQGEDGPPVMLISLKAGGVGLNLTAADHVFLCDPWWNPAAEAQAADRTHRIGQDKPVFIYRLVATDTVEERIVALQEKKRALFDAALGDAAAAAALSREDLLELLA